MEHYSKGLVPPHGFGMVIWLKLSFNDCEGPLPMEHYSKGLVPPHGFGTVIWLSTVRCALQGGARWDRNWNKNTLSAIEAVAATTS
jgi:hypothetical protein